MAIALAILGSGLHYFFSKTKMLMKEEGFIKMCGD